MTSRYPLRLPIIAALLAALALAALSSTRTAPVADAANGSWSGTYWNNTALTNPTALTRNDGTTLDFFWDGSPGPGVNPDNWSARWNRTDTYAAGTYRFTATGDDGIRVYVDGVLILDAWQDQPPTTYYTDRAISAGTHTVRVELYDGGGGATVKLVITNVASIPPGWQGQYYANRDLAGAPSFTRNEGENIDIQWAEGTPLLGFPSDNFSVRWTRSLNFVEGVHQFRTITDDGVRLFVDGQLIIDQWIDQGPTEYTANKQMTAGAHTVVMEYYEAGGGASAFLSTTHRPDLGGFVTDTIIDGLNAVTNFQFAPDGRIFLLEKGGVVRIFKNGSLLGPAYYTIPNVNDFHDRGAIGMTLDPNFASNGFVYLAYTYENNALDPEGPKTAQVIRVNANTPLGDVANGNTRIVLLGNVTGSPAQPSCEDFALSADCIPSDEITHTVGNLRFGPDGMLYVAIGDGAYVNGPLAMRSQNLDRLSGKMLRVNPLNGAGLTDNPFYNGSLTATRSKIWASGVRNAFRFNFRPGTSTIYSGDVGGDNWEEIDVVTAGANMGWPCYEGTGPFGLYSGFAECQALYSAGTAKLPIHAYDHALGTAAVVGGNFTGTNGYNSKYQNRYWFGDYARNTISSLKVDASNVVVPGTVEQFTNAADGPVDIEIGPSGDVYYVSINTGQLRRIRFVGDNRAPVAAASGVPSSGAAPLTVNFSSAGSNDPDAGQAITYSWDFGDGTPDSPAANPSHQYAANGVYTATLTVTDPFFLVDTETVQINVGNTPPVATINTPANGATYDIGDEISFTGSATDTQDGNLPASALSWTVILKHCADITFSNCHPHTEFVLPGEPGGDFTATNHGDFTFYEIHLTATDSGAPTGQPQQDTEIRTVFPNRVTLTFEANRAGAEIAVGGSQQAVPFTRSVPRKSQQPVFVPSPQQLPSGEAVFSSWSDGGAQSHTIAANANATYTANFADAATPTPTPTASPTATATPTNTPTPTATPEPNDPPTVDIVPSPASGTAPVDVSLAMTVGDPEGQPIDYILHWGDGSFTAFGRVTSPYAVQNLAHTYSVPGAYTISVEVFDHEDASAQDSASVSIGSLTDTDSDGMPDGYEAANVCLNGAIGDGATDADLDTLTNAQEYGFGTRPCAADSDGDNCGDGKERGTNEQLGGKRDPMNPWDFPDMQVPALTATNPNSPRNKVILLSDALAAAFYAGTRAGFPPNPDGALYDSDHNANGVPDGREYDRTASFNAAEPWRATPPNGAVTLSDALVVFAQAGADCR